MPRGTYYLEFHWANDGMNTFVPAGPLSRGRTFYDDDGFTNDVSACAGNAGAKGGLGLCARHRMITERGGLRRVDEASAELGIYRHTAIDSGWTLSSFLGGGLIATGPLGGAAAQDAFHRLIRWGRTLNGELQGQLQNTYDGGPRLGPRLRVGLRASRQLPGLIRFWLGGEVDVHPGVGASGGQAEAGLLRFWSLGPGHLRLSAQLALRHLRAEETRAAFPGAYPESAAFFQPYAGLAYLGGFGEVGFGLALNVEGTSAHQGVLSFRKNL